MADYKFVELIFVPGPATPAQSKAAYNSLARNPRQLFALLVEKEISTNFLSGFVTYGRNLARLFEQFQDHLSPPPEHQWKLRTDGFSPGLLEETLRAFLFLLLADGFSESESQEAMADIVMAVIRLSKRGAWGLIKDKLGEVPDILDILITDGRINILCQGEPSASLTNIDSNATTFNTWAGRIANLACDTHRGSCQGMLKWEDMKKVVLTFRDCALCKVTPMVMSDEEPESETQRNRVDDSQNFDPSLRTFESLIGDHLGQWKIVISAQALKYLTDLGPSGKLKTWISTLLLPTSPSLSDFKVQAILLKYKKNCSKLLPENGTRDHL